MSLAELFLIAVSLSMDAFAVAICKGLSMKKATAKSGVIVGLYFGIFQAGMPLLGYLAGMGFAERIRAFDHWVAFVLLLVIGANMVKESFSKDEELAADNGDGLKPKSMIPMAIATSIDALAVGVSFAMVDVRIVPAVSFIGITTFTLSFIGVKMGAVFGLKFKSRAEFTGGAILILMGLKILLEHLNILTF